MRIAVIGGGIAGLTAAYQLTKKKHAVTVFEKEEKLGGLAASFQKPDWDWPLEHYYHHFFTSDQALKRLAAELGLSSKLFYCQPKTSVLVNGQVYRFDTPQSILQFPYLNLVEKIRTSLTAGLLKLNPFWQPLENLTAADFLTKTMGQKAFSLIWEPLLVSKFGHWANQIPASWFWTRIKKRSFSLGYFQGGTQILIQTLAETIQKNGGQIFLKQKVSQIKRNPSGFRVIANNQEKNFDQVVATVSPAILHQIAPEMALETKSFKSLGSLCLILVLKDSFLTDGTYWLNINDQSFPFVAVVEHTNFIDKEHYGGHHLLYIGGYYPEKNPLLNKNKDEILKAFLPYLKKINPNFEIKKRLIDSFLFKDQYSQPVVGLNYSQKIPKLTTSLPGFYWVSLHHVYPEDRGVNYAILEGEKVAHELETNLQKQS